jgi:acetyl esterase/lipase
MPTTDAVRILRDQEYRHTDAGALAMDLYYPPDANVGSRTPAVVFVTGFSDVGAKRTFGCAMKDMAAYVSWARLVAVSGVVAVTYTNRELVKDACAVIEHVRDHAASLGIDKNRIGLWSCSGNVPVALSLLMSKDASSYVRCAALSYGYMLDADGATGVAEAAGLFGFVNPCAGRSVDDIADDVPLFVARAGHDRMPRLNEALDRFIARGLACNLPLTFVNHANGPHGFDLFDDSETSREVVRRILAFLCFNLLS